MKYRTLGRSGLKVSVLTMETFTFGGQGAFAMTGSQGVAEAERLIATCMEGGINLFDTSNMYSLGLSEEILGAALGDKRNDVLISSKARMRIGDGPNDEGVSRFHLVRECERSLQRLKRDHIDIYYMHEWDGTTPLEEMLGALDTLVRQGKIRYIGCSNYSGWHVMKALGVSDLKNYPRFVTQQIHYTLEAREAEYELLPIAVDQGARRPDLEPARGGPAVRRASARSARASRIAPGEGMDRAADPRPGTPVDDRRRAGSDRRRARRLGPPRSPWPGCSSGRASPRRWSAARTRRSSGTISRQSTST